MRAGLDSRRREVLRACLAALAALPLRGQGQSEGAQNDIVPRLAEADEQNRSDVDLLFSTKSVRVRLAHREFILPANFLTPKGRDFPLTIQIEFLRFFVFLPDFEGFTKKNWEQGWFNRGRIDVVEASQENAHRTPQRVFEVLKRFSEPVPFREVAGLSGYRRKNGTKEVMWCGDRRNGEFFCLESSSAPGDQLLPDTYPLCKVQYFRRSKGMFLAYQYSMDHLKLWEQIDEAIWDKLEQWRVK